MQQTSENPLDGLSGRRLKEAIRYVSRTWLPINVTTLRQIQLRLAEGFYTDQRQMLINDIKSDLSLLAFCFRKLEGVITEQQAAINPIDTLRQLEIGQLTAILSTNEEEISSHRMDEIKDVQALRVRHSLISCGTAEVLARKTSLDPDVAYSCALLRQLGFMLVAWNYPSSFQQAMAAVSVSGNDIETELAKILGFDPAHLGYEVALHWNNCPELRSALGWRVAPAAGLAAPLPDAALRQAQALSFAKFSGFGEALAKVNNKEHYPKAVQEWKEVEAELTAMLGEDNVKSVTNHIQDISKPYAGFKSDIFLRDASPESSVRRANAQLIAKLLEENSYVKRCPQELQREFRHVYERICYGQVSTEGLNMLVSRLIPRAGFVRGCVFLLDPKTATLIPRVRIGDVSARFYKPVVCSASGEHSNPIAEAFHCTTPIKQEGAFLHNDIICHVSGRFGRNDKGGVLHLEMSEGMLKNENHIPILYFKAIRSCLDHCLNLF